MDKAAFESTIKELPAFVVHFFAEISTRYASHSYRHVLGASSARMMGTNSTLSQKVIFAMGISATFWTFASIFSKSFQKPVEARSCSELDFDDITSDKARGCDISTRDSRSMQPDSNSTVITQAVVRNVSKESRKEETLRGGRYT